MNLEKKTTFSFLYKNIYNYMKDAYSKAKKAFSLSCEKRLFVYFGSKLQKLNHYNIILTPNDKWGLFND